MKLLKYIKDRDLKKGFSVRYASRAIIFDRNGLIPILFVSKYGYHKLPGGGIEENENKMEALDREIKEETGCRVKVKGEVGMIVEDRYNFNLKQTSYCYWGEIIKKGKLKLEQSEIDEGFKLVWMSLDNAIKQCKKDKPTEYEGKFIRERDLCFLEEFKEIIK